MKCLGYVLLLASSLSLHSQAAPNGRVKQTAKQCFVNVNGDNNQVARLTCVGINDALANQLKAIADAAGQDSHLLEMVSAKLDSIQSDIKNWTGAGNLKERCLQLSSELSGLHDQYEPDLRSGDDTIASAARARLSDEYLSEYNGRVGQLRDDFARLNIRDDALERNLRVIEDFTLNKHLPAPQGLVNGGTVYNIIQSLDRLADQLAVDHP